MREFVFLELGPATDTAIVDCLDFPEDHFPVLDGHQVHPNGHLAASPGGERHFQIDNVIVLLDEFIDELLLGASVFPGSSNPSVEGGRAFIGRAQHIWGEDTLCRQAQIKWAGISRLRLTQYVFVMHVSAKLA